MATSWSRHNQSGSVADTACPTTETSIFRSLIKQIARRPLLFRAKDEKMQQQEVVVVSVAFVVRTTS